MDRWRAVTALTLVAVGSAAATHGPDGVEQLLLLLWAAWPFVIIAVALLALIRSVAPPGTVIGPLLLVLIGVGTLALRHGLMNADQLLRIGGAVLVATGGVITMETSTAHDSLDPVWRRTAVLFPKLLQVPTTARCPKHLAVTAIGTRITVDLRKAPPSSSGTIEVAISCLGGTVELLLPEAWAVVAGRLESARGIRFSGNVDHPEPVRDPHSDHWLKELPRLAQARARLTAPAESVAAAAGAVVIHVSGVGGRVSLPERPIISRP